MKPGEQPVPASGGGDDGGDDGGRSGGGNGDRPNPDPSRTYWEARKQALPVDFHGDHVEPHEISFVEKFLDAGERLEWIPLDPDRRSSNDFMWTSNGGIEVEVKRTKAGTYSAIHGRIVDSASKAAKHGVVKENFIADLGDVELTDELAAELAQFNVGRRKYRLKCLWVMTRGRLVEIDLEK